MTPLDQVRRRAVLACRDAWPFKTAQHVVHALGLGQRQAENIIGGRCVDQHILSICGVLGTAAASWILAPLTEDSAVSDPSVIVSPRGVIVAGKTKEAWAQASGLPRGLGIDHREAVLRALGGVDLDGDRRRVTLDPEAITIEAWSALVATLSGWSPGAVTVVDLTSDGREVSRCLPSPTDAARSICRPGALPPVLVEPETEVAVRDADPALIAAMRIAGDRALPGAEADLIRYLGANGGAMRRSSFVLSGAGDDAVIAWLGSAIAGPLGTDPLHHHAARYVDLSADLLVPANKRRTLQVIEGGHPRLISQQLQTGSAIWSSQIAVIPLHEHGSQLPATGMISITAVRSVTRAAA